MKDLTTWIGCGVEHYRIGDVVKTILEPKKLTKPHYLYSGSRFFDYFINENYYNIESGAYFPSEKILARQSKQNTKISSSEHLMDAFQNMVDVVGYFEGLQINLNRELTPTAVEDDENEFGNLIYLNNIQTIQNIPNVVPLDTDVNLSLRMRLKETYTDRIPLKFTGQVSFTDSQAKHRSLFLHGEGGSYITLKRKHTHELLINDNSLVGKLFEWYSERKNRK